MDPQILAALVGAAIVWAWERLMKPAVLRHQVAKVLAIELAMNLQFLFAQVEAWKRTPKSVPADLQMYTGGWSAANDHILHLPGKLLGSAMILNSRFEFINRHVEEHGNLLEQWEDAKKGSEKKKRLHFEMEASIEAIKRICQSTFESGNKVLPSFRAAERLIWLPWQKVVLSADDLRDKTNELLSARDKAIRKGLQAD